MKKLKMVKTETFCPFKPNKFIIQFCSNVEKYNLLIEIVKKKKKEHF